MSTTPDDIERRLKAMEKAVRLDVAARIYVALIAHDGPSATNLTMAVSEAANLIAQNELTP